MRSKKIIKPKLEPVLILLKVLPFTLCFGFMGYEYQTLFSSEDALLGSFKMGLYLFLLASCLYYFVAKKTYDQTKYALYNDKIEYFEGFLTVEQKTVMFKNIKEVNLRKGLLQRLFGLGTIILSTHATGGYQNSTSKSGVYIKDIENPDMAYKQIKSLLGI